MQQIDWKTIGLARVEHIRLLSGTVVVRILDLASLEDCRRLLNKAQPVL
jgi:hypothetical protein